jgi:hypothetical protein
MKQHRLITTAVALSFGISFVVAAHAGQLRAGAAKVSITPTPDEFPYVVPHEKDFVGVHDDVYARALVLDNGTTRAVIVIAEVEAIPDSQHVVDEVAKAVGVPVSNVIATASHTHSSLTVFIHGENLSPAQKEEIEHVRLGAVEAARQAVANLQPAQIAFSQGQAFVNINNGDQAGLKTRFDPTGPSDKTLGVVRVQDAKGAPLALLLNYATHAETMFRSVTKDGGYEVSGDIPGAVSKMLESTAAGAPVVLYMAGAEADQRPIFESLQLPVDGLPAADEGAAGWGLLDQLARRLSASVLETLTRMKPGVADVTMQIASGSVSCPGERTIRDPKSGQATRQDGPPVTIPLSALRINEIGIAAIGGDVGSDIGKDIRAASPVYDFLLGSQLAGAVGYIVSDVSYEHGKGSPLKEGCADAALSKGIADLLSGSPK